MANRLVKKTALYFVGNAASKVMQACFIPIYAFSVAAVSLGEFDYVQTIAGVVAPAAFLAIWEAVLRFCLNSDEDERPNAISSVVAFSISVFILLFVLSVLASVFLEEPIARTARSILIIAATQGIAQIWQYLSRSEGKSELYVKSGVIGAAIYLLTTVLLLVCMRAEYIGLVASYVVSQFAIFLYLEMNFKFIKRAISNKIDFALLMRYIRYSAPLILNLASMLIMTGFGRVLVTNVLGSEQNGYYVFAMKFASIVTAVGGVVSMASIEETILRIGSKKLGQYYSTIISNLWTLLLSISSVAMPAILIFYCFLSRTEYAQSFVLVPIFMAYAVFNIMSTNYGNAYQASLRMPEIAMTSVIGMAVTVVVSFISVDKFGVVGVASGLCMGMASTMLIRCLASKRMIDYGVPVRKIIAEASLYAVVSTISILMNGNFFMLVLVEVGVGTIFLPKMVDALKNLKEIPD